MKPTTTGMIETRRGRTRSRRVAEIEQHRHAVGRAGEEDEHDPREHAEPDRRSQRRIARPVERLWKPWSRGEAPLDPRPEEEERRRPRAGTATPPQNGFGTSVYWPIVDVEARHEAQAADQPAEVPVRLRAVRREVGVVRPPEPDRVDLREAAEQEEHAGDDEEQPERARRLARERRNADELPLGLRGRRGTACGASARRARGARRAAPRSATGKRKTCAMYMREKKASAPGNGPSQISSARFAPTNGIDSATE